ncbi:MAG: lysozyme [Gammaproteobacteria bacterium]|jgi:lysozyme|nr:lysozyme [Gammaproteobacteria bacterium]
MSVKLREMIKRHEGVRRFVYRCSAGALTIGVGRNIDPNKGGIGLSDSEVDMMLTNDIARVYMELESNLDFFHDLDEARQDVMIDMCFNLGLPRFLEFRKMLAAVELGDYERASAEMLDSRWADMVKGRAITLSLIMKKGEY